jgi:hypothetical protein
MTSAPPWFSMVAVKLMPNFSGVIARPRLRVRLRRIEGVDAGAALAVADSTSSSARMRSATKSSITWP